MADPRMKDASLPLAERIDAAVKRITTGQAAMRIPVEATDPDVVLMDCKDALHEIFAALKTRDEIRGEAFREAEDACEGVIESYHRINYSTYAHPKQARSIHINVIFGASICKNAIARAQVRQGGNVTAPTPMGIATRKTAEEISRLVSKFPGLGDDVFVHEHDYNQVANTLVERQQRIDVLERELHFAMHPDPTLTGIAALRDAAFRHGMAATAELTRIEGENANLRTVMIAAAEEIDRCWHAHCDAEGYGPVNLMRRLEEGIPSEYGYSAGAFKKLDDETKALRAEVKALREAT